MNLKNKVVAALMSIVLLISAAPIVKAEDDSVHTARNTVGNKLIPTPQHIQYKEGTLPFTNTVNIVGGDQADPDAMKELTTFLTEQKLTINKTENAAATTIFIGEANDHNTALETVMKRLHMKSASTLKDEGYVLRVDAKDTAGGTIVMEGKDGDGTYYAVQTLKQLAKKTEGNVGVQEVNISDEPTISTRGVIEGFYGTPWTQQDRLDQIKFYGDTKQNTYIYAPKDDPYHREKWREPYPSSEMERMKQLIQTAKGHKVDFVFALSPGIDISFDGSQAEADYQALVKKCNSLYDMGVRSFAIFFDDIKNKEGSKQAALLNRFNTEFIQAKKDVKPLLCVPTEYDTNAMRSGNTINSYTKGFSQTLDPSIKVLWTGSAVVPEGIDVANAQLVKSMYGDRMGIWWNYPVTDYIKDKLALGPMHGLDKGLAKEVDIFVANPMEHAQLSKIALATGADYAWNTPAYDEDSSFHNALDYVYKDLAPYMKTFANHSTRLEAGWASTGRADAPEVRAKMDAFIKKMAKGQDTSAEVTYLRNEFHNMVEAANHLKAGFTADEVKHCASNLDKLKALGENDALALDLALAIQNQNNTERKRLTDLLKSNLPSLQRGSKVSEKTALAFITDILDYDPNPKAAFTVSKSFVAPGVPVTFTNASSISSTDLIWTFKGANIKTSNEENPVVIYPDEGVYTVSLTAKNKIGEDKVIKEGIITVSKEAVAKPVNLALHKTAAASSFTGASEAPEKAIDGITSTKWCATGNGPHTLTIDLGKLATISDIIISHAEKGGEGAALNTKDYRIQVSKDGKTFKEIYNVIGNKKGLTNDAVPVNVARYVKLIVDKPTQGGDNAARIYEVQVMGLDKAIALPPLYEDGIANAKKQLQAFIKTCDNMDMSQYEEGVDAFNIALSAAKDVAANNKATLDEIQNAHANLQHAKENLKAKPVLIDKETLGTAIAKADKIDGSKYQKDASWKVFTKALEHAKEVMKNAEATQKDVDESVNVLTAAMQNLTVVANQANLQVIEAFLKAVNKADEKDYSKHDYSYLMTVKKTAETMLKSKDFTEEAFAQLQKDMTKALDILQNRKQSTASTADKDISKHSQTSPNTGDITSIQGIFLMMVLGGLATFTIYRKRKN